MGMRISHGGILAIRSNPKHMQDMKDNGIKPIDLVVVNLYPFKETVAKPNVTEAECIENIDIGGPAMLRAAAKNFRDVIIITNPARYKTLIAMLSEHALAKCIREETGWVFSDNLAHKCCKIAGIKSKAKHYRYRKPGNESVFYPNIVRGSWTANAPLRVVVSDMTCIRNKGKLYEWTLFVDTFNNEIIAHSLSGRRGDSKPYFACLERLCSMDASF